MRSRIVRSLFRLLATAFLAFAGICLASLNSQAKTMVCYHPDDDRDGDGYAQLGARTHEVGARETRLRCPGTWIDFGGDCNDYNAAVHPRRSEVPANNQDDNCNVLIDEPEYVYVTSLLQNSAGAIRIHVHLNDHYTRDLAKTGFLWVNVKYFRLYKSNVVGTTYTLPPQSVSENGNDIIVELRGLEPATVYAARVHLFRFRPATFTVEDIRIPKRNINFAWEDPVGDVDMVRFYSMTDSSEPNLHRRYLMVMKALMEYQASARGEVGYTGSIARDGTRYQAELDRKWCSEFYVWNAKSQVAGIAGIDNWEDLREFFSGHHALYGASGIPTALPGDYLSLDSDNDGDINHSAMFLAYDGSGSSAGVWTLEGNRRNAVDIQSRPGNWDSETNPTMRGVGKIKSAMWR